MLRLQGHLPAAEAEAREGLQANRVWDLHHGVVMPLHALARVLLATGHQAEATGLLARLAQAAAAAGRWGRLTEIRQLQSHGQAPGAVHLSGREQEILCFIAAGRSNQEIARTLVVAWAPSRSMCTTCFRSWRSVAGPRPWPGPRN